ncbi:MOSC domain-containing protein [Fredinandcohnia sp. 179-A 10B2 NHS]|uniref:MOSC domain-containing protein n=1 Tax=Fredinandcohnia sp. 179-A 10B2 NHS TaxID=3235176 RepID=UPI0039A0E614
MEYKLVALNVGKVKSDIYKRKELLTGIYKTQIQEKVFVSSLQISGDEQADLVNHGGPDKVICVYPHDHYPYWSNELGIEMKPGAFGENFTVEGLTEDIACIGDIFAIGEIEVQVSLPRQPCFKVAHKLKKDELPVMIQNTGYSGFYLRVLKEGHIEPGQSLRLLKRHPKEITVSFVNQIKYHDKYNREALEILSDLTELSQGWKDTFRNRLAEL